MYPCASAYLDNSTCAEAVDMDRRRAAVTKAKCLFMSFSSLTLSSYLEVGSALACASTLSCLRFGVECPLWVISGQTVTGQNPVLSALVQKRTNAGATGLSAKCQKRTHAPQQSRRDS